MQPSAFMCQVHTHVVVIIKHCSGTNTCNSHMRAASKPFQWLLHTFRVPLLSFYTLLFALLMCALRVVENRVHVRKKDGEIHLKLLTGKKCMAALGN